MAPPGAFVCRVRAAEEVPVNKFFSRKLGVTLATLLSVVFQGVDPVRAAITAAVGIAYVIAQAFVDRGTLDNIASAAQVGLATAAGSSAALSTTAK